MRVLMITPELPSAGEPGSMAPAARQFQSLAELGISIDVIEMRGVRRWKYAQAIPRLWRKLKSVDLVHAHFGYCGWLARTQTRKPVVVSFMGDDLLGTPRTDGSLETFSRTMVRANRRLARMVQAVIVKSQEMAEVIAPTRCHVIPNGVDVDLFRPIDRDTACRFLGWPTDRQRILFPGNPSNPRKGYQLAQALVQVAGRELSAELELVPLWGVAPDQVALQMNACDAMVMTSLIEGSPNVVKEAMACDRPIVAVPVGDVAERLADVPGCHVGPRDAGTLGGVLAALLRGRRPSSGRAAIQARGLDLASVAGRIRELYREILASGPLPEEQGGDPVHRSQTKPSTTPQVNVAVPCAE